MTSRNTTILFGLCALAWAVIVIRAYTNVKDADDFVITVTQGEVQSFARERLREVLQRSFDEDIELCGIIFERSDGSLGASDIRIGDEASCGIAYFDEPGMRPVASFHTHAGQNEKYDSEVPSLQDLESDAASELDGYVATPGGRFWRVNASAVEAVQVCGPGCLPQDPDYKACAAGPPKKRYSRADLIARMGSDENTC